MNITAFLSRGGFVYRDVASLDAPTTRTRTLSLSLDSSIHSTYSSSEKASLAPRISQLIHRAFTPFLKQKKSPLEKSQALDLVKKAIQDTHLRLTRSPSESTKNRLEQRLLDLQNISAQVQKEEIKFIGFLGWGNAVTEGKTASGQGVSQYDSIVFVRGRTTYVEQLGSSLLRHQTAGLPINHSDTDSISTSSNENKPLLEGTSKHPLPQSLSLNGALYTPDHHWNRVDGKAEETSLLDTYALKKETRTLYQVDQFNRALLNIKHIVVTPKRANPILNEIQEERKRDWYWRQYLQWKNVKATIKTITYSVAFATESSVVGSVLGAALHFSGLSSEFAQYTQGRLEQKEGKASDVYRVTMLRAGLNFIGETLGLIYMGVEKVGLGIAGAGFSILADSVGIYKLYSDIQKNNAELGKKKKELLALKDAPESIEKANKINTIKDKIKYLKTDTRGQIVGILARGLNIVTSVIVISLYASGIGASVTFLVSNPIGWSILGITALAMILFWASSGLRLGVRPIPHENLGKA